MTEPASSGRAIALFDGGSFTIGAEGTGPPSQLSPTFDVSRLPGARLVSSHAWSSAETRAVAGCAVGPSDRWVDGLEGVLFEKATWLAVSSLQASPTNLAETSRAASGPTRARRLEGRDAEGRLVVVEHLLAFHGDARELVLCSLACEGVCDHTTLALDGTPATPPEPSWTTRAVLAAAGEPRSSALVVGATALLVAVVLVTRRPRRRTV